jgi:hypothetical protein
MGFSKSLITFFSKVVFFKKGASMIFSFISSFVVTLSTQGIFDIMVKDADKKQLLIPIISQIFHTSIFSLLIVLDSYFGKRVSLVVRNEPFNQDKLVDTSVKYIATGIFTCMLMGMSIGGELMDWGSIWWTALMFQNMFWIMSSSFEYSSIGRHFESIRGYKPNIFLFHDKIMNIVEFNFLKGLDKSFPILGSNEQAEETEKTEENEK